MPYADIVVIALIAAFILLRLRSVLGQKNGNEDQGFFGKDFTQAVLPQEPVVHADEKLLKAKSKEETDSYLATLGNTAISDGVNAIREKDPLFTATTFLEGAKMAYEMVFDVFVKGDRPTLKMLLSDPLYADFCDNIDAREKETNRTETTLVAVSSKEIVQAALTGNMARVTVKFVSQQVTVVRDASGAIIQGNASELQHSEDEWVFERDVASKNPNWKIIET